MIIRGIREVRRIPFSIAGLFALAGCAVAPPIGGQGARIIVSIQVAGGQTPGTGVNPNYQYFFLVRNGDDDAGVNGPIPVVEPPYGNGFATGTNTATAAFTDFVVFGLSRQLGTGGFGVYHVPGGISGDPNRTIYDPRGVPDVIHSPTTQTPALIRFEIGLCRFAADPSTCNASTGVNVPRFLQINVVATTTTPINPNTVDPSKFVDAFGEQRLGSGSFNSFVTIDTATARTYESSPVDGHPSFEPDNDTYPAQSDPAIEMTRWSVQVIPR